MVMLYDPQTNSMTEFMDLKTETRNFSAVVLGDEIVIMAGFINLSQNINEVYKTCCTLIYPNTYIDLSKCYRRNILYITF